MSITMVNIKHWYSPWSFTPSLCATGKCVLHKQDTNKSVQCRCFRYIYYKIVDTSGVARLPTQDLFTTTTSCMKLHMMQFPALQLYLSECANKLK